MRAFLIKNGFSKEEAWDLDDVEVLAYAVAFGEMDGGKFDWKQMRWEPRKGDAD